MDFQDCDTRIDEAFEFSAPRFFDFVKQDSEEDFQDAQMWFETTPRTYPHSSIEAWTPKVRSVPMKCDSQKTSLKTNHSANRRIACSATNSTTLRPRNQPFSTQTRDPKQICGRSVTTTKKLEIDLDSVQENQAIKRQKLDGGNARQIVSAKPIILPHKSRPGIVRSATNLCSSTARKERKTYAKHTASPFISTAEMVKRFESRTRENVATYVQKTTLSLTKPVEPDLQTASRIRSTRLKSSSELEEEMMANVPKFKSSSSYKKTLESTSLPVLPRSNPQKPQFQEFHFETMERACQRTELPIAVSSTSTSCQNESKIPKMTESKLPHLETSMRARPLRVKSSVELEQEELEKVPKFKARPLNRKIFEGKGSLGILSIKKRQTTIPREFHFATEERIPSTKSGTSDVLSFCATSHAHQSTTGITTPHPFHLETEVRGVLKEQKLVEEVTHKMSEEERARIPKALPYPSTTEHPSIPPKPEPKQCTKAEPFELESVARHIEELQREKEIRLIMEQEEAQMRVFKAQPILKDDPLPLPEKVRKPLTEVLDIVLNVDCRAVDRAEFESKIKEKEILYKRYREECEYAKMIEEERALKQLRKTMVPHARPVPNFDNPFLPQKSSKEFTLPKSPNLHVSRRKQKDICSANASLSPASRMR